MRKIDTGEYISVLRELVENGLEVSVKISGDSMYPFLHDGRDTAFFKAPDRELRVGDIVFFRRGNGQYILHRICRIDERGYYLVGDSQRQVEGPISAEQIFALVTHIERNGKTVKPGDFLWDFYAKVWLRIIPLRTRIIRLCAPGFGKK